MTVEITRALTYPPYDGGPLPPWYADAGYPFRDAGAACLAELEARLGPIEDVDATWRATGSDPDLAFDDWRAVVRCERGVGQIHLAPNARPTRVGRAVAALARLAGKSEAPRTGDAERWAHQIADAAVADRRAREARFPVSEAVAFLVTGASGNLGRATVQRLRADGHRVRVFQRRIPATPAEGVEYVFGNLGDPDAVARAVKGADVVIHCGAATKGGWPAHRLGTVVGTDNVVAACRRHDVKQLVYISSMSVLDWAGADQNGPVTEATATEPRPEERGAYTRAKLEAERLVAKAAKQGLPAVILRPGQIFGGGIPLINGAVARNAGGRWLVLGDGKLELPLVYLDDVVDAIMAAIERVLVGGEVIQIIDPDHLTQDEVLGLAGGARSVLRIPRAVVLALGKLSELPLGAIGRQSPIAVYRLRSALARLHYESDRARSILGWQPRVGVREGIRRVRT